MRRIAFGLMLLVSTLSFAANEAPGKLLERGEQATSILAAAHSDDAVEVAQRCCKHCSAGKACGDSCISREKQCRKGPGCACD